MPMLVGRRNTDVKYLCIVIVFSVTKFVANHSIISIGYLYYMPKQKTPLRFCCEMSRLHRYVRSVIFLVPINLPTK